MKFTLPNEQDAAALLRARTALAAGPELCAAKTSWTCYEVARIIELQALLPPPVALPRCPGCNHVGPEHYSSCQEREEHDPLCLFWLTGASCDCGTWKTWLAQKWQEVDNSRPSEKAEDGSKLSHGQRTVRDLRRLYLGLHGAVPIAEAAPGTTVLLTEEAHCERFPFPSSELQRGDKVGMVKVEGEMALILHRDGDGVIPKDTMVFLPEASDES